VPVRPVHEGGGGRAEVALPTRTRQDTGVGFYSRHIFPALCDYALDRPLIAEHRRQLLARAHGRILEIGFGTGLNLPHYPPSVRQITAIDPNQGMSRRARRRIRQAGIAVELCPLSSEQLPFADGAFDCIVSTFTLCSVRDVSRGLAEVYRVLAPGGQLLFLEHGLAPDAAIQKWQRRLNPLQVLFGDGCHLDRRITTLVAGLPFSSVDCAEFYLPHTPKTHGYLYQGVATR